MREIRNKNSKHRFRKKALRLPIAMHFYSSFALVIMLSTIITNLSFNSVVSSYIEDECITRIDNAVYSCSSFANAFSTSSESELIGTDEEIKTNLIDSILTSTDISNNASMVLMSTKNISAEYFNATEDTYSLIWPMENYSTTTIQESQDVLNNILLQNGISVDKTVKRLEINDIDYYYRFVRLDYHANSSDSHYSEYDNYYLLFYVDSTFYSSFVASLNTALISAMIVAIIAAGIISILVSYPIIHSARALNRFASRISRGNFKSMTDRMTSTELNDLSESMNQMAYQLDANDQEQKTFFQNASHELRTPLMSIQGYAEGIKYGVFDNEKQEEAVDIIISETTRLSTMVENLLSISKMDLSASGNYQVKKQILSVFDLSSNVIDKVRGGFLHNGKELVNELYVKNEYIYANENDIYRMLENILSNALRYAKHYVYFNVSTKGDDIVFDIYDDGPGIDPELATHIFDRFAKGSDGKHGIGLALAKAICKEHNGTITANNHVTTHGAQFIVSIPKTTKNRQLSSINNEMN